MQDALLSQQGLDAARLVETAAEGVWVIDADSVTTYVNARMAGMLGYAIEEMLGVSLFAFMDDRGREAAAGNVARRRDGVTEQHDFKFCRKDDGELWVIIATNPFFDEAGVYAGSLGMVTDITKRKHAEDALRESEERYRALAETVPQLVWVAAADGSGLFYNQRWEEYTGRPTAEILAHGWTDLIPDEDIQSAKHAWRNALRTVQPYELECRIRAADGQPRWFLARAQPCRGTDGALMQWVGTCTEIHAQKEAANAQRFLIALEDQMRQGSDAEDILGRVVSLLGEHLSVSRCALGEINEERDTVTLRRDYSRDSNSVAGTYPSAAWGEAVRDELRAGRTVVFEDTGTDPHAAAPRDISGGPGDTRAAIHVPIMQASIQRAMLVVQHSDGPRRWTPEEIALVQTVADRAWLAIENARLRRAEREQYRRTSAVLESIRDGFLSLDHQWCYTYVNRTAECLLGRTREEMLGHTVWEIFPEAMHSAFARAATRALDDGAPIITEVFSPRRDGWFEEHIYPSPDGLSIFFRDITLEKRAEAERRDAADRQRAFMREALASVTDGRLRLCDDLSHLPTRLTAYDDPVELHAASLTDLRHTTAEAGRVAGLPEERIYDLLTAVGEAGMNAVIHAGGGVGQVYVAENGGVQVWVEDRGKGIAMETLPRAALEKGFTTAGTLGHGLKMMIETLDRLWLLTGPEGTTVVLEQDRQAPVPVWL